ncbi:MAG: hypothetical protein LWW75_04650 [Chlorobiales bacterium]|nr:hypothetical protein [Chlorobiales bacterium]
MDCNSLKKVSIRISCLMLLASSLSLAFVSPSSAAEPETASATAKPDIGDLYTLHHNIIPGILFSENGSRLFNDLFTGNTSQFLDMVESGVGKSYAATLKITHEHHTGFDIVIISFPEPFPEPLCRYAALVKSGNTFRYLTLEEGNDIGQTGAKTFLCEWSAAHKHLNYGPRNYTDSGAFRSELLSMLKP